MSVVDMPNFGPEFFRCGLVFTEHALGVDGVFTCRCCSAKSSRP